MKQRLGVVLPFALSGSHSKYCKGCGTVHVRPRPATYR